MTAARLGDLHVVALDRQLVAAQADRAAEPVAQRVEHAVADPASSAATSFGTSRTSCTRLSVGAGHLDVRRASSTRETGPHEEVICARAGAGSTTVPRWVDVDELDRRRAFERLVGLLADPGRVDDERSRVAAGTARSSSARARWRDRRRPHAAGGWADRAEKRFARADWGERQLLLRALAVATSRSYRPCSRRPRRTGAGSPLAAEVSQLPRRAGRSRGGLTVAELAKLDVGLQPLVGELIDGTTRRRGPPSRPRLDQWRQRSIDTDFFRELGRSSTPATTPGHARRLPDRGGRRARGCALAAQPRSVLLVGEQGVGKTTLIVEALRRLGAAVVRVPGGRRAR